MALIVIDVRGSFGRNTEAGEQAEHADRWPLTETERAGVSPSDWVRRQLAERGQVGQPRPGPAATPRGPPGSSSCRPGRRVGWGADRNLARVVVPAAIVATSRWSVSRRRVRGKRAGCCARERQPPPVVGGPGFDVRTGAIDDWRPDKDVDGRVQDGNGSSASRSQLPPERVAFHRVHERQDRRFASGDRGQHDHPGARRRWAPRRRIEDRVMEAPTLDGRRIVVLPRRAGSARCTPSGLRFAHGRLPRRWRGCRGVR
jgi:hypothetical protein